MWLVIGFISLGLLIGSLVGLTAESAVTPLLGLLFAFVGGSVIAVLGRIGKDDRKVAGQAMTALAISCLVGAYAGIFISEYQLLSPNDTHAPQNYTRQSTAERRSVAERKYLRSTYAERAQAIDMQLKNGQLSASQAYEQLYALINEAPKEARK